MKDFKIFYIAQSPQSSPPSTDGTRGMFDSGWVPLFQTLAWIVFWAILIRFIYRNFNLQLLTWQPKRMQRSSDNLYN
jgi:hypothetical protein